MKIDNSPLKRFRKIVFLLWEYHPIEFKSLKIIEIINRNFD